MNKKLNSFQALVYSTNPDAIPEEQPKQTETLPPSQQHLKISLDKKQRKGKVVTLIDGFTGTEEDLNELAKKLKTKCGSGGSAKDGQIIIQGDFKLKITGWLKEWTYKVKG
jgi:translation initiation factor 1